MNEGTRKQVLVGSSLVALAAVALWLSYGYLTDQQDTALAETSELASCRQLASQIEMLQGKGVSTHVAGGKQVDVNRQIATAMAAANIEDGNLQGVHPDSPRHSAKGSLVEKPTRLVFRRVTLQQFTSILQALNKPEDGLRIERLHLSADNESPDANLWTADMMLIQTVPDKAVPAQAVSLIGK